MSKDATRNDNDVNDEVLVSRVNQSLEMGDIPDVLLEELERKLARVRRWGGVYSEIEFSPDIQLKLDRQGKAKSHALVH